MDLRGAWGRRGAARAWCRRQVGLVQPAADRAGVGRFLPGGVVGAQLGEDAPGAPGGVLAAQVEDVLAQGGEVGADAAATEVEARRRGQGVGAEKAEQMADGARGQLQGGGDGGSGLLLQVAGMAAGTTG